MSTTSDGLDLRPLDAQLAGHALAPGDEGWDDARQAWNLAVDQRPAAVVSAADAADAVAAVGFAGEHGLRVAAQGTGHAAAALGSLERTLLLKTRRLGQIEVDAEARRARIEAGVLSAELTARAGEHGLAPLTGSSPDVGVVGFSLGGGLGWLGRRHGLACNSVLAIELVTADGRLRRVDADEDPELFWALRGGGGGFGVVTALEAALYPIAEVYAGAVMFDVEHARDVLSAYRDWAASAPREVTSSVRFLTPPPLPTVPEPLRGRALIGITAAHCGDAADAQALLRPLREVAPAVLDGFATMPAAGLSRIHGEPEQPVPGLTGHTMLGTLTDEAIDALVAVAGARSESPLLVVDLRQLGGALAEAPQGAGSLGALEGEYAVSAVGALMAPEMAEPIRSHLAQVEAALEPWATGRRFLNFSERPGDDASASFSAQTYAGLREVKARVDPQRRFHAAQEIEPA